MCAIYVRDDDTLLSYSKKKNKDGWKWVRIK